MRADVATSQEGDELYGTTWDLEVLDAERVDTKGLDDHRAELAFVRICCAPDWKYLL